MPLSRLVRVLPAALLGSLALAGWSARALADGSTVQSADAPVSFAYDYGEVETPRSAALSGAMRAAGNAGTAMFSNPANIAETRVYHIEAFGMITPEYGRQVYGGAVVDSTTNRLSGGLAVTGGFLDPKGPDRSWIDVRLALAYPISDNFFIGLGGRYLKLTENGNGPLGDDKVAGGLKEDGKAKGRNALVNLPTFDAGFTVKAGDMVYIGASGQNLTFTGNGYLPATVGGGVAVATSNFTIEADGVADISSYSKPTARIMAGGEYLLVDHVPLRLGYRYDQGASSHQISGGVGFIAREFSIEASVRRTIVGPNATMIFFGAAYYLESSGLTKTQEQF